MSSGKPDGPRVMIVGSLSDQVYSYEDDEGRQFHWSVTKALVFAQAKNAVYTISLHDMGVTLPLVRAQYQGLDERHALTCDLSQPLLFVPLGEKVRLIDGWHRVAKALLIGADVLPACFLTRRRPTPACCGRPRRARGSTGDTTRPRHTAVQRKT